MAEKNEQLKAQFVLDTGSLSKSIDLAGSVRLTKAIMRESSAAALAGQV